MNCELKLLKRSDYQNCCNHTVSILLAKYLLCIFSMLSLTHCRKSLQFKVMSIDNLFEIFVIATFLLHFYSTSTSLPPQIFAMSHYLKTVLAVVVFAKVQGLVMFESPRTRRVRRLSDFTKEEESLYNPFDFAQNTGFLV